MSALAMRTAYTGISGFDPKVRSMIAPERTAKRWLGAGALGLLLLALHDTPSSGYLRLSERLDDFRAFYCAGALVGTGADIYRVEPLRTCERRLGGNTMSGDPSIVIPVPYPGYDLAPFAAFARLPFGMAAALWVALLVAAVGFAARLVFLITGTHGIATAAAMSVGLGLWSVILGQIPPFELLFIAATGYALQRARPRVAGIAAVLTLLSPQIGLPVVIAVAILAAEARAAIGAGILMLAFLWLWTAGPAATVEYVRDVIPLQGLAEASFHEQYSLRYLLSIAGVPGTIGTAVNAVAYVAGTFASIGISRAYVRREHDAMAAFVPAAIGLACSSYWHAWYAGLMLPAAFVALAAAPRNRLLAAASVALVSLPWPLIADSKQLLAIALLALGCIVWDISRSARIATGSVVIAAAFLFLLENNQPPNPARTAFVGPGSPHDFASAQFGRIVALAAPPSLVAIAAKVPTWTGIVLLLVLIARPGAGSVKRSETQSQRHRAQRAAGGH